MTVGKIITWERGSNFRGVYSSFRLGVIKSVGEEYQVVKRGREYGCGEE